MPKRPGGQRKQVENYDPTNQRIRQLEAEVIHLTDERNRERQRVKAGAKTEGLFRAIVEEMDKRVTPFKALPPAPKIKRKLAPIEEHVVMHLSDGHHDQVITAEECGGFERHDFQISCARAERYALRSSGSRT